MNVRVTDILRDPLGNPYPNTQIRVTATEGANSTLKTAPEIYTTGSDGSYDFNIVHGKHDIEVLWDDTWDYIGNVIVNSGTPNPTNLQGLIEYSPQAPTPPTQSTDPTWTDCFNDVCSSNDSCSSCICEQVSQGNASDTDISAAYCNERLCATLGEHKTYSKASPTECVSEVQKSYSDHCGSLSSDYRRQVMVCGGCIEDAEIIQRDGQCNWRLENNEKSNTANTVNCNFNIHCDRSDCTVVKQTQVKTACNVLDTATSDVTMDICGGSMNSRTRCVGTAYERTTDNIQRAYVDNSVTCSHFAQLRERLYCDTGCNNLSVSHNESMKRTSETHGCYVEDHCVRTAGKVSSTTCTVTNDLSCEHKVVDCFQFGDIACFDQVNNRVTFAANVTFNPADSSCICATPDRVFDCYQYSVDGCTNWHDPMVTGDKYRRNAQVIHCGVDGCCYLGPFSTPAFLAGQDGAAGDTCFYEFQYSSDNAAWHNPPLISTDKYRREREVSNGTAGAWSAGAPIVGSDGDDGEGVTQCMEYSHDANAASPNWHPNFSAGDYWRRERFYTVRANGSIDANHFHEAIYKLNPEKGVDYVDGVAGKVLRLNAATQAVVYDSTGKNPNPATVLMEAVPNSTITGTKCYRFYVDGTLCQNSTNACYTYTAQSCVTAMPDLISATVYEDGNAVASDQVTIYGVEDGKSAVTVIVSNEAHSISTDKDGNNGVYTGSGTDVTVYIGSQQLTYGTGNNQFTVSPSGSGITVGSASTVSGNIRRFANASNMTGDSATITFNITAKYSDGDSVGIAKVQSFSKSKKGVDGAPGADGTPGSHGPGSVTVEKANPGLVNSTIAADYRSGVGLAAGAVIPKGAIINYVGTSGTDTPVSYVTQTGGTTGSPDGTWVGFDFTVHGSAIINGTLAAEAIVAGSITGTQISSATSICAGSGNDIAVMSGSDTNYRFWSGCAIAANAPFRVCKNGCLIASNAYIEGAISAGTGNDIAALGNYAGNIRIYAGCATPTSAPFIVYQNGDLLACAGTFCGTVYAEKIDGDIVSGVSKTLVDSCTKKQGLGSTHVNIITGSYLATRYTNGRTLSFSSGITFEYQTNDIGGSPGTEYVAGYITVEILPTTISAPVQKFRYNFDWAGDYDGVPITQAVMEQCPVPNTSLNSGIFSVSIPSFSNSVVNSANQYTLRLGLCICKGTSNSGVYVCVKDQTNNLFLFNKTNSLT